MIAGTEHMGLQCALYFFGLEHATGTRFSRAAGPLIACSSFLIQRQRLPGRTSWLRTANERSLFHFFLKC